MSFLDVVHGRFVFRRRVKVLTRMLAERIPQGARVLDVGCGDGTIAKGILAQRPDVTIEGIDIKLRPETAIPVVEFDGAHIPHADKSFDVVQFVDVLHHTEDPTVLLKEAARVARKAIILKDHAREGVLAEEALRLMDWVGNARHGVLLPYNYFSKLQWKAAFQQSGLAMEQWEGRVGLYVAPASLLFDRDLHFVAKLAPA